MSSDNNNKIVLDLESKKTFDEVGGQHNRAELGVSFVGVFSYKTNKYYGFWEKELETLEKIMIKEKPLLIGFNTIHFDNPVLQPYFRKLKIATLPQLDLLAETEKQIGFRIKLDNIAQTTLAHGKSGTGLDAINYYRTKQFDKLANYCIDDVKVTKGIYEYGMRQGQLWYANGGEMLSYPASWAQECTIPKLLKQAVESHQRLKIKYLQIKDDADPQTIEREIDVLELGDEKIKVFDHHTQQKQEFKIKQIIFAKNTQQKFAHQKALC